MALHLFPSRLALKSRLGSLREAPLAKVSFPFPLEPPATHTSPLASQTGWSHFHASVRSGPALRMTSRSLVRVALRQSPSSSMYVVSSRDGFELPGAGFFIAYSS